MQIDLTPRVEGGSIHLRGRMSVRDFDGFVESAGGVRQPVFSVREANFYQVLAAGKPTAFWIPGYQTDEQAISDVDSAGQKTKRKIAVKKRMALFLSATPAKLPAGPKLTASPAPVATGRAPDGVPVPGKPGFVTSPHAPAAGAVDVRGFGKGMEVKCPYSGKVFLVP